MTEDEAKTKWCPMLRTSRYETGYCIGSACMVWRDTGVTKHAAPNADRWVEKKNGFCGLAGAPQ